MAFTGDFVTGQPVTFQRARKLLFDQGGGIQEGVVNAGDLMVTQRGAGANMSVDVAAGVGWVQIDTGTNNGLCHVSNDAVANVAVTASNGTNPRIDQLIVRYNDTAIPTGSGNTPTPEILTGTATAGATLANRTGAAAVPNDCLRLADILVPAASSSVVNTTIRDRRQFSRGAFVRIVRTTNAAAANNYTTTSTTLTEIDATNLKPRVEFSGVPIKVKLQGGIEGSGMAAGGQTIEFDLFANGASQSLIQTHGLVTNGVDNGLSVEWSAVFSPGSQLISPAWKLTVAGASLFLICQSTRPVFFTVEEVVRQNTANNTVTSG